MALMSPFQEKKQVFLAYLAQKARELHKSDCTIEKFVQAALEGFISTSFGISLNHLLRLRQ